MKLSSIFVYVKHMVKHCLYYIRKRKFHMSVVVSKNNNNKNINKTKFVKLNNCVVADGNTII